VVTWILLGIIVIVFGLQTLTGGSTETEVLVRMGAKANPLIAAGEYWRLFTAMFLHIGVMHLAFNSYALIVIGTELERLIGWQRYLAIYILSGLLGNLASYAFSMNLAAGASGAIFGLIGALAAYFLMHRTKLGTWGQKRLINIAILIAINLFLGFTQPGIDNMAHMGGLLAGLGLGWAMAPRYKVDPVEFKLVDTNRFGRYWPALAGAILIFVGGTVLATAVQRDSVQSSLWRVQLAVEQEDWDEVVREVIIWANLCRRPWHTKRPSSWTQVTLPAGGTWLSPILSSEILSSPDSSSKPTSSWSLGRPRKPNPIWTKSSGVPPDPKAGIASLTLAMTALQ